MLIKQWVPAVWAHVHLPYLPNLTVLFHNSASQKCGGCLITAHKVKYVLYKNFPENGRLQRGLTLHAGSCYNWVNTVSSETKISQMVSQYEMLGFHGDKNYFVILSWHHEVSYIVYQFFRGSSYLQPLYSEKWGSRFRWNVGNHPSQ